MKMKVQGSGIKRLALSRLVFGNVSCKVCKILNVFEYTGQSNKHSEERQMNMLLPEQQQ